MFFLENTDVKEYLFSIDARRLAALMGNAGIRMSVFPHLYEDGVVIPAGGFENAACSDVPFLMVTGSTEFSFFCLFDAFFSSDAMKSFSEDEINAAKAFATKYGSDMYRIFNAQCSAEKLQGFQFCGNSAEKSVLAKHRARCRSRSIVRC